MLRAEGVAGERGVGGDEGGDGGGGGREGGLARGDGRRTPGWGGRDGNGEVSRGDRSGRFLGEGASWSATELFRGGEAGATGEGTRRSPSSGRP